MSYIHYSSSLGNMVVHLVFTTKYRHKIFVHEEVKKFCCEVLHSTAKQYGMKINEIGIDMDMPCLS